MLEQILLGTYTRRASQGIYKIALDTTQGRLTEATLLLEETSPTYLALSQKGELLASLVLTVKVALPLINQKWTILTY